MPEGKLSGKTALVTGSGRRIGYAISLALGSAGANVVTHCSRDSAELTDIRRELDRRGVQSWALAADFTRPAETETLITRAEDAAGRLDILINNASLFSPSTLQDMDFEGFMNHMQINAWAPLVLGREFVRRTRGGAIVNVLDTRITGNDPAHAAYLLSKQALAGLTRMMAIEFAPSFTVNAVAPGLILPPLGATEAYLEQIVDTVPLRRHGSPADIASAVLYLVQSDFVTGQILYVDGGRHVKEYLHGPNSHP